MIPDIAQVLSLRDVAKNIRREIKPEEAQMSGYCTGKNVLLIRSRYLFMKKEKSESKII